MLLIFGQTLIIFFLKKDYYIKKNINLIINTNDSDIQKILNFTIGCSDNI